MRDLFHNLKETQTRKAEGAVKVTENFTGVDHQGFHAVDHVVQLGESLDTLSGSVFIQLILQDSDDNITYAPVTDANDVLGLSVDSSGIFALIDDPAEDGKAFVIGYRGIKRFSRVRAVFTGTHTNGIPVSALANLGLPTEAAVTK